MLGWIKYLQRVRVETDALKRNKDFGFYPNPSVVAKAGFLRAAFHISLRA
jgi:hypothetical protein